MASLLSADIVNSPTKLMSVKVPQNSRAGIISVEKSQSAQYGYPM